MEKNISVALNFTSHLKDKQSFNKCHRLSLISLMRTKSEKHKNQSWLAESWNIFEKKKTQNKLPDFSGKCNEKQVTYLFS